MCPGVRADRAPPSSPRAGAQGYCTIGLREIGLALWVRFNQVLHGGAFFFKLVGLSG